MTAHTQPYSPRKYARIVGVLYLLIFFLGPVAFFMGRTQVVVPGDPAATVARLMASETSFRLGMVAETAIVLIEIVISSLLYVLLRPVSRPLALASALARFAQAVLQAVNLLTAVPALLLLGGSSYLQSLSVEAQNALVLLFMEINAFVILIWGLIFGFHLLLFGSLIYLSGFWPRILGVLLLRAGLGYLLVPQYQELLATVVVILSIPGELALTLWLLTKGLDEPQWQARALADQS